MTNYDIYITEQIMRESYVGPRPSDVSPTAYELCLREHHDVRSSWDVPYERFDEYFNDILVKEFPDYTIMRNVPVTSLAGYSSDVFTLYKSRPHQVYKADWGLPYSFIMCKGGQVKAAIMLGHTSAHNSYVKMLISKMYAKKMGIPYIPFHREFRNDIGYVVLRIKKFLME